VHAPAHYAIPGTSMTYGLSPSATHRGLHQRHFWSNPPAPCASVPRDSGRWGFPSCKSNFYTNHTVSRGRATSKPPGGTVLGHMYCKGSSRAHGTRSQN